LSPASEAELVAEPEPTGGAEKPPHTVHFGEAPKFRLPETIRRRILTWTWRVLAAALLVAVVLVVWPRRHGEAGKTPAGAAGTATVAPQTPSATNGSAAAVKTDQPSAAPPGTIAVPAAQGELVPAPPAEKIWQGITIEIAFQAETWIHVRGDGAIKINGLFPPGTTARAQADSQLLIHTGNAGGFTFLLNGRPAKPLGRSGQVLTDIKITLENLKDFLENPSSGTPAG
jgi:hypothetical protein